MRALIVEDDPSTSRTLELMLSKAGVTCFTTDLGEDAIDLAKLYEYDAILLDLNLPDVSGHEVLRHLRQAKVPTPVLVLTGDGQTESKLKGFGAGADDYITKPFSRAELVARLHAIVRRSKGHAQSTIHVGGLELDLDSKTVTSHGSQIKLTGKEYEILELLCLRKDTTISKEVFLNHLYGGMDEPDAKIIDVFICKLRKKLMLATGDGDQIETVWGRGYVIRSSSTNKPDQANAA